jgi:integrase/recombinase XerD
MPEQVDDRPSAHAAGWQQAMRRAGLARGTILARTYALASWDASIGAGWREATWRDVESWLDGRPLGERAQASAVSHLRAFYRWARREGLTAADPCADVATPRLPIRLPRPVRAHDVDRAVGDGGDRLELAAALMAYAGLRCCEVARLTWGDVDLARGLLYVTGKGGRQATVPIAPPLAVILATRDAVSGPVVAAEHGGPLAPARVSALVGAHLRRLGIRATAHQLRHYAGTHVLELGGDVMAVRDFLRHASVATTQVYAQLAPARLASIVADW